MGRPFKATTTTEQCPSCFVILSLKKCAKCKAVKPRGDFSDTKTRPDGKYSYCKDCRAGEYQKNKDKLGAKCMANYWKDRDKHLVRFKKYRSDPEVKKRIYAQNKANYAKQFFERRARELDSGVTGFDLWKLWHKQRGQCGLTEVRLNRKNAHLDHIHPRARKGGDELQNLRWVLREVNHAKRDMLDYDFIEMCRKVVTKANKENFFGKHLVNDQYDNKGGASNPQHRGLRGVIRDSESSLIGLDAEITILERNAPDANKGQANRQPERLNEKTPAKAMR